MKIAGQTLQRIILCGLFVFFISNKLVTANTLKIDSSFVSAFFNEFLEYYEDVENSHSFSTIFSEDFHTLESPIINFKYTSSTYWFKGEIYNSNSNSRPLYLINRNHFLENLNVYVFDGDSLIEKFQNGALFQGRQKTMPFMVPANKTLNIIIEVSSTSPLRVPLYLLSAKELSSFNKRNYLFSGIVLGVYIFLFILTILIIVSLKEKIYIYFGLCILSIAFFFAGYDDLLPKIAIFGRINFIMQAAVFSMSVFQFCYLMFSKLFFNFNNKNKTPIILINILLLLSLLHIITFIFSYTFGNKLVYYLSPFIAVTLFALSVYNLIWLKQKNMRFFVLGTMFLLIGVILHIGANAGIIKNYIFSFYALKTSYLLLLSVFAYALTDRLIIYSRNFTRVLNEKVEERTAELEQTLINLKTRQQQLVQSEKMASVGVLTSGLAHELNNPLNFINGGLEILKQEKAELPKESNNIKKAISFVEMGLQRSTEIVSSILEFSYRKNENKTENQIESIIDRTLNILEHNTPNTINIIKEYNFNRAILIFRSQLHQLFLNLFDNAIYFVQQGSDKPEIKVVTNQAGAFAEVSIFNNGPKITEEALSKIFDPFYTSREIGQGTGLGLSSALAFINEHKGSLLVENTDNGVVYIVKLPLNND